MNHDNDIKHGRHCVFNMHVHLVFVTKYRRGVFTKEILGDLSLIFSNICIDVAAELLEFDGEDDHVHLLVNYPPKMAVSKLVNSLKGISSLLIRKKNYQVLIDVYGEMHFGLPATLLAVVAAHPLRLFVSILSSNGFHFKITYLSKEALTSPP